MRSEADRTSRLTPTTRMLVALVAGIATGLLAMTWPNAATRLLLAIAEPVGRIWVNALQMTVIPLVASLLVSGLAASIDTRATGRLGLRALVTFLALLGVAGVLGLLLAPPLVARIPLEAASAALRSELASGGAAAAEAVRRFPALSQLLVDIVPANPIRAATEGAMLPLVVFAVLFGLAAAHLPDDRRGALVDFFRGVAAALLVIVGWVIRVGPIGVFALAVGLAVRTGLAGVGALALYVLLLSALIVLMTLVMYAAAATAGGVPLSRFVRAAAPPQAVAFSSRSSLAALPAMLEARLRLGLPPEASAFVLPLAVTTLRVSTPIMWAVTMPFLARLYGGELGYPQLILLVGTGILLSFSTPGLPSASLFLMAPFLAGLRIPVEALGLVLAADAIPDLFKGVLNVTGHLAATAIVVREPARNAPRSGAVPAEPAAS